MPGRAAGLVMITLSLLHVFVASAGVAVAKLTPEQRLAPEPPSVARRAAVGTSAVLPAAGRGAPVPDPSVLARRLTPLLDGAGMPVNAVVTDVVTGRRLFAARADRPATPASTTKLATSVAALAVLGPGHRLTTRTVRGGDGAVVLVGGGDPTLTKQAPDDEGSGDAVRPDFASLADLARRTAGALEAEGVRRVRVDYDASAFTGPTEAGTWKPNYLPDGEVAPVTGLMVDAGREPGSSGDRESDPARAAAEEFARLLDGEGVKAEVGDPAAAGGAPNLAAVRSPTAAELVEYLMTESDNDLAEAMARQVAIKVGLPASFDGASQAVMRVLAGLGVDGGVLVHDGSGLSPANRITPAALAALVSVAASPDRPRLRAAITGMPVAAFTGTLSAPRYTSSATDAGAGVVRAKTGTLDGVTTLAGVVHDRDGRLLAFAFMGGDGEGAVHPGALDRLAAAVASCGCR